MLTNISSFYARLWNSDRLICRIRFIIGLRGLYMGWWVKMCLQSLKVGDIKNCSDVSRETCLFNQIR